jgi:raffinose/stachyose/melibiose transport system substrate-binding protein
MYSVRKCLCILCVGILLLGLAACGQGSASGQPEGAQSNAEKTPDSQNAQTEAAKEPVTIKFFSVSPDRTAGPGLVEETIIGQYIKENPNVKIEVEALQDEPYKQKFKAYIASNELPDLFMAWGYEAFFGPVMRGGYAAELNKDDYKDYTFLPTSLDGFSYNGKLYGLSKATDFDVMYYNKAIFQENGIEIPATFQQLIEITKLLRSKGIAPCAMNGKDEWNIISLYNDLYIKESNDRKLIYDAVARKTTFADNPVFLKTAEDLKALMDVGFFQNSFSSADYGAARNLFTQEKAAMYYMGSWEVGLQSDKSFPESFLKNVSAFRFPEVEGGKGKATDLFGNFGGGYAVSSASPVKEEAIKFLNYMMMPDNWAKISWQSGGAFSSQNTSPYVTGNETELQKTLMDILNTSTSLSGQSFVEASAPSFKTAAQDLGQALATGIITPEKFIEELDKAADIAAKQLAN